MIDMEEDIRCESPSKEHQQERNDTIATPDTAAAAAAAGRLPLPKAILPPPLGGLGRGRTIARMDNGNGNNNFLYGYNSNTSSPSITPARGHAHAHSHSLSHLSAARASTSAGPSSSSSYSASPAASTLQTHYGHSPLPTPLHNNHNNSSNTTLHARSFSAGSNLGSLHHQHLLLPGSSSSSSASLMHSPSYLDNAGGGLQPGHTVGQSTSSTGSSNPSSRNHTMSPMMISQSLPHSAWLGGGASGYPPTTPAITTAATALNAMHDAQQQMTTSSHPQDLGLAGIPEHQLQHQHHPHLHHSLSSSSLYSQQGGPAASAPIATTTSSLYEDSTQSHHHHPYSPYSGGSTTIMQDPQSHSQQIYSHPHPHPHPGTASGQHQQYRQPHRHIHGAETPPSPSTGEGGGSHRHSLSDSMPYTPQSYTSPASSIPNSLHTFGNKQSFDSTASGEGGNHPIYSMGSTAMNNSSRQHLPTTPTHVGGHYPITPQHHQQHQHSHSQSLPSSSQLHHQLQQHAIASSPSSGMHYTPPHHTHPHHQHTSSSTSSIHHPLHQQSHPQFQQQPVPYPLSHSAQGFLTVYSATPMYGAADTPVTLEVGIAPHDPHHIRGFRVLFGSHGTTTRVVGEYRTDGEERVELVATTPPIHVTNRIPPHGTSCQISLQALDETGKVADWSELGVFEYTDISSPSKGHKRPGSPLTSIRDSPGSTMRPVFPDSSPYMDSRTAAAAAAASHKRGHSRGSSIGSLVNGFGHMTHHSRNSSLTSNLSNEYEQLAGSIVGAPQTGSTMWYSTPDGELIERKPIARLRAAVLQHTSTPSSSSLRHPPMEPASVNTPTLYRTSQLPTAGPDGSSSIAQKAALKFEGDLNNMALGWSHDEWHAKRRLVLFTRKQEGGIIHVNFRPTSLQEITPNTIVISCIFRDDKNECFVTSVDTIYLLEALVSVRFTVEEKNRIRRNLEGYKPITITKAKADCENFFKVIMGFPNPKPRNIEKDVKVFPWKILANAMKKIISKYSASFLQPEEMVGPGKPPPQPIGWAPGRTPPPSSQGTISPQQRDDAQLGPPISPYPGGGGGPAGNGHSMQMGVPHPQQSQQSQYHAPFSGISKMSDSSSYESNGEHMPPGTASSTMGGAIHTEGNSSQSIPPDSNMTLQLEGVPMGSITQDVTQDHAQYHTGISDDLATPNANYDPSHSAPHDEMNPFQFT